MLPGVDEPCDGALPTVVGELPPRRFVDQEGIVVERARRDS
jgi:hypothetical protein